MGNVFGSSSGRPQPFSRSGAPAAVTTGAHRPRPPPRASSPGKWQLLAKPASTSVVAGRTPQGNLRSNDVVRLRDRPKVFVGCVRLVSGESHDTPGKGRKPKAKNPSLTLDLGSCDLRLCSPDLPFCFVAPTGFEPVLPPSEGGICARRTWHTDINCDCAPSSIPYQLVVRIRARPPIVGQRRELRHAHCAT
jgi:hypothetical protein